jgi:hypothetical protein
MKQRIDLDKAAQAETFGALAVTSNRERRNVPTAGRSFTPAQSRALSELIHSLVQVARKAGARRRRIAFGAVSLELQESGIEEILSIRTGIDS